MTVRELKDTIDFMFEQNPDAEVYIGEFQTYGSDFCHNISEVTDKMTMRAFYGSDDKDCVMIIQGNQCGVIGDDDDDNDDDD